MITTMPKLTETMRARADQDGLPQDHALRTQADRFDEVTLGYVSELQEASGRDFFCTWSTTRRIWSEYSGEPVL